MEPTATRSMPQLPSYTVAFGDAPQIQHLTWLGEGDDYVCYLVNDSVVFRCSKHAQASTSSAVERCLLSILHEHLSVAVPEIVFAGFRNDNNLAFMGYPLLAGQPLERHILEALPPAIQQTLIAQVAEHVRGLHRLPLDLVRQCQIPVLDPRHHLTAIMVQARTALRPRLLDAVWQYYEQLFDRYVNNQLLHTYQPALLHGDLSPDHFLADTDKQQITGIIDWGDCCISDPAWDLVYVYEDYGLSTLHAFLVSYAPDDAQRMERKVRVYQQLNNVAYALSQVASNSSDELEEALDLLEQQMIIGTT